MLIRSRPPPASGQRLRFGQRLRYGTCEEANCLLMRDGGEFVQSMPPNHPAARSRTTLAYDPVSELARIVHPKGYPCGPRCPNEYCPCTPTGRDKGVGGYPHTVVDDRYPPLLGADGARIGESEMFDRIADGVEAITLVRTRGV